MEIQHALCLFQGGDVEKRSDPEEIEEVYEEESEEPELSEEVKVINILRSVFASTAQLHVSLSFA